MAPMTLTATATCSNCNWHTEGDPASTDKAADTHTRTAKHSTAVTTEPERTP
jgi:hypothetical protein